DGVGGDGEHDDDGRRAQHPAEAALGPGALRQDRLLGRRGGGRGGDGLGVDAHGTRPFESSAAFRSLAMLFSWLSGLMPAGGETAWEITIDRFWYAGVSGRTAAVASESWISLANGYEVWTSGSS